MNVLSFPTLYREPSLNPGGDLSFTSRREKLCAVKLSWKKLWQIDNGLPPRDSLAVLKTAGWKYYTDDNFGMMDNRRRIDWLHSGSRDGPVAIYGHTCCSACALFLSVLLFDLVITPNLQSDIGPGCGSSQNVGFVLMATILSSFCSRA